MRKLLVIVAAAAALTLAVARQLSRTALWAAQ